MSDKELGSIEWLEKQIEHHASRAGVHMSWALMDSFLQEAKEIREREIKRAYTRGDVDSYGRQTHPEHYADKSADQYYKDTFGETKKNTL